ncbi:MAG: PAS domain S-box protein [Longimicrobiales bacterium]
MNARGGFGPRVIDAHILVVDDEPFILEALVDLLEDHFRVSATTDPDEALELLDREDVAVVLSDQRMPGMSGHELMRLVKEKANARRIIFTAYADWEDLVRAVNQGQIHAYVTKPWDPGELRLMVQKAVDDWGSDIQRQARIQELDLLNTVLSLVGEAPTMEQGFHRTLGAICDLYGLPCGEIWRARSGPDNRFARTAAWSDGSPQCETFLSVDTGEVEAGRGLPGLAWTRSGHTVADDLGSFPDFARRQAARQAGLRSALALPVPSVEAVLILFSREPIDGDADHMVRLLSTVGAQLGAALDRKRAEDRLRAREEQYRLLADNISDVVSLHDARGVIEYVSPSVRSLLGCDPARLVGVHPAELTHPDDPSLLSVRSNHGSGPLSPEVRLRHEDGRWIWVEATSRLLEDTEGGIEGILLATRDVSERRASQEALHRSEARFRALLENITDGVYIVNEDGTVRYASPASTRITGFEPRDRTGGDVRDLVVPEDREFAATVLRAAREQPRRTVGPIDIRLAHRSGAIRRVSATARNLVSDPDLKGIVLTVQDVTDRRAAELRAEHQARQQAAAARLGLRTLAGPSDLGPVLQDAVDTVADTLNADIVWLLERADDREGRSGLRLRAASGLDPESSGASLPAGPDTVASQVLRRSGTTRFGAGELPVPELPAAQGATWGVAVVVEGQNGPFGLLGAYFRDAPDPDQVVDDFVQTVANHVGTAVARSRSREAFLAFFELSPDLFSIVSLDDGCFREVNASWERVLGWSRDELLGRPFDELLHPDDRERMSSEWERASERGQSPAFENRYRAKDGSFHWLLWNSTTDHDAGLAYAVGRDLTERRRMEEQVTRSQKLEAVGRLAGGVAHDFNNLLTVVLNGAGLALERHADDPDLRELLGEMSDAALRGRNLTRQLLAFGKRQISQPQHTDANQAVTDLGRFIRRILGDNVAVESELVPGGLPVFVDPTQLEQVLMNLVINARDAMPHGGAITLRTRRVEQGSRAPDQQLPPGTYAVLEVEDTGEGIPPELQERIFEPFFTTKEESKGTGLGLATSYGIAMQAGGALEVESEVGRGSVFRLLLPLRPRTDPGSDQDPTPTNPAWEPALVGGDEAILVVDDDPVVRRSTAKVLGRMGYDILEADSTEQALVVLEGREGPPPLIVSDMVMSGASGAELAAAVHERWPSVAFLLTSGYSDDEMDLAKAPAGIPLLQKPFTPAEILGRVRSLLDNGA